MSTPRDPNRRVTSVAIAAKINCAVLLRDSLLPAGSPALDANSNESPKISHLVPPLIEAGYHVHVVTLSTAVSAPTTVTGPRLTLTVCPARPGGKGRDFFAYEREAVRQALLSHPVDVVHAHHTYEYALGALATGLPTLVTVRDWAPYIARTQFDAFRLVKLCMQMSALMRGSAFTVNSPYLQQRVRRVARRRDIPVIPNCLPDDHITQVPREPNLESPAVIAINRGFGRRKNVKSLLRAFPFVRERHPGAQLTLVGAEYGPNGPAEAWANAKGLADGVVFAGSLPNDRVLTLLDSADLLAHPSLEETFGIVLIESMARGTPVVGGHNSGAVPWVLADGSVGILTQVQHPRVLGTAMADILEDPVKWRRLSQAGRAHVRRRFSAHAVTSQYARCYEFLLDPTQAPEPP